MQLPRRKSWLTLGVLGAVVVFLVCVFELLNPRLTTLIESDKFREEMEKEGTKGSHFPSAHYEPIKRVGPWTVESARVEAKDGWKAMSSVEARGIPRICAVSRPAKAS